MIFCQDFCKTRNVQNFLQTLFPGLDTFSPLRTTYSENRQQTGVTEKTEQMARQSWSEVPGKILEEHDGDQCAEQCVCEDDWLPAGYMYTDKIIVAISVGVDDGDDRHRNGDKDL